MVALILKRSAASEAAQLAEERRASGEYLTSAHVGDTTEAEELRANFHQEMILLGRSALSASRQRRIDALPGASRQRGATLPAQPASTSNADQEDRRGAGKGECSRGSSAMVNRMQNAMRRRPMVKLTVSTAAPAPSGQKPCVSAPGSGAYGSGAPADDESGEEYLESGLEESCTDEDGEGSA